MIAWAPAACFKPESSRIDFVYWVFGHEVVRGTWVTAASLFLLRHGWDHSHPFSFWIAARSETEIYLDFAQFRRRTRPLNLHFTMGNRLRCPRIGQNALTITWKLSTCCEGLFKPKQKIIVDNPAVFLLNLSYKEIWNPSWLALYPIRRTAFEGGKHCSESCFVHLKSSV